METEFITLDDMILGMYEPNMLTDFQGVPLAPKLDHAIYLIHKLQHFSLKLAYGKTLNYFMRQCFPTYNYKPLFSLQIMQGDPKDRLTWSNIGQIGQCQVALDSYHAQLYIQQNYPMLVREDEPPVYFIIPLVLV